MATVTTANRQEQYLNLRRKLTDLNYTETFGIEALDLVERLLNDCISTTQSYRQLQEKESRLMSDLSLAQAQLFPLRKENARLARENHELHLDHIKQNEESRYELDKFAQKSRELSDQITEQRLMNKLYEDQIKEKDEVIEKLREAYEEISDPALKTKHIIGANIKTSSKIVRDQALATSQNNAVVLNMWRSMQTSSAENHAALLSSLQSQNMVANLRIKELEEQLGIMRSSLAAREQELSRTSKLIGNAAAKSKNVADTAGSALQYGLDITAAEASNKRIIDQLNGQVDFLNGELAYREAQLATVHAQLTQFEAVRSELGVKSSALDKVREENSRLNSRVQFLENKVITLRSVAQTASHTPRAGGSFFGEPLSPVAEAKEHPLNSLGGGNSPADTPSSSALNVTAVKVKELENSVQRLTQEKEHLQRELRAAQQEIERSTCSGIGHPSRVGTKSAVPVSRSNTASINNSSSTSNNNNTALVVELNKEVEDLRKKNIALTKQVKDSEGKLNYLQSKEKEREQQRGNRFGTSPSSASPRQAQQGANSIAALEEENHNLQSSLREKERLLTEALHERDRYFAMIDVAREEAQRLQQDHLATQRKFTTLQDIHADHVQELESLTQRQSQLSAEKRALVQQVQQLQSELQAKDGENQTLSLALRAQEDQNLRMQRAGMSTTAEGSSSSSSSAIAATALASHEIDTLQRENEVLKRQLTAVQAELRLADARLTETHIEMSREEENRLGEAAGVSLLKTQIDELRASNRQATDLLVAAQLDASRLEAKLTLHLRLLDEEKSKRKVDVEQLQTLTREHETVVQRHSELINLVKRLESGNQMHVQRQRSLEEVLARAEHQVRVAEQERSTLAQGLREKDDAYNQLRHVLEEMDLERDKLQETIKYQEENLIQKTHEVEKITEQLQATKALLKTAEQKVQSLGREHQNLHKLVQEFDSRHQGMKLEIDELKLKLTQKLVSEGHAAEDLLLMTQENQALSRDLSAVLSERDTLRHQLREVHQSLQTVESDRHALEIEKQDILENFRAVAKEKRRCEEDLKTVSLRQTEEVGVVQRLQQERQDLLGKLQIYASLEERWAQERSANSQQLDVLNDKLVQYQRRIETMESDSRRAVQEYHGLQQNHAMLNERNAVIMKRASAAGEANKVLTSRLTTVERERDALRALIEVERQRALDMSKVAETARIEAATKDIQLQRLRTELEEAQAQHNY